MKKVICTAVFFLFSTFVYGNPPQNGDWGPYMSAQPNEQDSDESSCALYAAIHCLEGLYNYYYGLGNSLELDVRDAYNSGLNNADAMEVFDNINDSNKGVHPLSGYETFPNFQYAYYSCYGEKHLDTIQEIKDHLDLYGPVCVKMGWGSTMNYNTRWYSGGTPLTHSGEGDSGNYHWVVAVDWGGSGASEYIEFLSSFETDDSFFFKMYIGAGDWLIYPYAAVTRLHDEDDDNSTYSQDPDAFLHYHAPKIYPNMIPYLVHYKNDYDNYIDPDNSMHFKNSQEQLFIMSDTIVDNNTTISDAYHRTINIWGELVPGGGYNQYRNDIIANYNLTLQNCTITGYGPYNYFGAVYVNTGGLHINGNVTIQNLEVGIYTKSNNLSTSGTNNRILDCDYHGIVLDNATVSISNLLINNMGNNGIRLLGSNSDLNCTNVGIYSSAYGIYVNAYTDLTLNSCNIGYPDAMGGGYDIDYTRIIQGGNSTTINLDYNNISHASPYYAMDNIYNSVFVDNNWWGNDPVDIDDVFSSPVRALYWNQRATIKYPNTSTPLPKIAAPSPFELARSYESVEDWTNAKSSYLQAIEQSNDSMLNKRSLKGMLRIYMEQEWTADDLRIITRNEYVKAENKHKPVFDFLYNETYVAEKDYFTAIEMFEKCAKKYAGSSVEVEMLSRIANIYGDYLDDPAAAKRYADRAAALNPGQPILMSAYMSAGIWYNPDEYSNKFYHVLEYYDIPEEHDAELVSQSNVTVSPNPFNPSTVIGFTLTSPSRVELSIYSITGQKVATLVNGNVPAGRHSVTFDGVNLASGIYFYRFESEALNKTGKLMLMK